MQRDRVIAILLGGFAGGVFVHSLLDPGISVAVFLLVLGPLLLWCSRRPPFVLTACFLLGLGAGLLRYDAAALPAMQLPMDERVSLAGVVVSEPSEKEGIQRLIVAFPDMSRVLVSTSAVPTYQYGDELIITGKLVSPKNFAVSSDATTGSDPVAPEFDWVGYLAKDGISYQMFRPEIRVTAENQGNPLVAQLFAIKGAFTRNVERVISEPASALLGGLVLGAKTSLGEELTLSFRRTGVSHIVALSGYNMTIVADTIMRFFSFLPRVANTWLGVTGILLFSIMAGAGATVVRAAIMALIVIFARTRGNRYNMGRALVVAGFLMIVHNPRILVFDVSFQLSFLATLGILYGPPLFEPYFRWLTERWQLRSTAVTTTSAQAAVLPLILYKMGSLSLVALPVNILILPAIPATMFFGFLTGVTGFFSTLLSLVFAYPAYLLLAYELGVVELFAQLPFAALEVYIPLWAMLGSYGVLGVLVYRVWTTTSNAGDRPVDNSVDSLVD